MFMRPVRHVSGRSSGTWCAMITLALTGDVMLGRGVAEVLDNRMRPEAPWGDVMPLLDAADLRIINLECAITDNERPWTRTPKSSTSEPNPLPSRPCGRPGSTVVRWPTITP